MRVIFVLAMLVLLSVASAETIQFGNYMAIFDMRQPHIIQDNALKTYDGKAEFFNDTRPLIGYFVGDYKGYSLYYSDKLDIYRILPKNDNLTMYLIMQDRTIDTTGVVMESSMNLTDTIDFLNTLKIEKTNSTKPTH